MFRFSHATYIEENLPDCAFAQYGEFRNGYAKDKVDTRIVTYGLRYFIEQYVSKRWTLDDVERADAFFRCAETHNSLRTSDLFLSIVPSPHINTQAL